MPLIRPNFVAAYIIDPNAKPTPLLLLLKRTPQTYLGGIWQIVTGKVDKSDESILQTVKREVFEETGLTIEKAHNLNITMFYDMLKDQVGFSSNFLIFTDHKENITLSAREHSEYFWCSIEEGIKRLAFSQQKEVLAHIEHFYLNNIPNEASLVVLDSISCK